ncbi:MAG: hypothetical protein ABJQ71_00190 [Roseibium sp.]
MSNPHQYIALMTSLPHLGNLFARKEVPISDYRLRQRLSMLETDHEALLKEIIAVTTWAGVSSLEEDLDVITRALKVIDKLQDYPDLQHLVSGRMETRTIIAALRKRRDGQEAAGDIRSWGFGRWCSMIKSNWSDPGFGLSHFMPWIAEAHRLMQSGDHISMERLALRQVFEQLDHYDRTHKFDFEAVCVYVQRWVVVERWTRYNTVDARTRLETLVAAALQGPNSDESANQSPPGIFSETTSSLEGAPS